MQLRNHPVFLAARRHSPVDRIVAKAFDGLIAASVFSLGNALSYPVGVVLCFSMLLLQDGWGQSVGKRLFGLTVLQDGTDRPIGMAQSAMRNMPFALGVLLGAIPAFWVFFVLVFVPLLAVEVFFLVRLDSGARLGDVLADTYVSDFARRPNPSETIDESGDDAYNE